MSDQAYHIVDISSVHTYSVRIEFTDLMDPQTLCEEGLPLVSVSNEIEANSSSPLGEELRKKYDRIPYGAPLYTWEVQTGKNTELLYIGQTMLLSIQKRFEGHATGFKILSKYVNDPSTRVYYRLCSRLDLCFEKDEQRVIRAIEHFPIAQARRIVDDIEAYLIFKLKPRYNMHHKNNEKQYWKSFSILKSRNILIS